MGVQVISQSEDPIALSAVAPPLCPVIGYHWRPYRDMPDRRLPRHIQALSALVGHIDLRAKRERKVITELSFMRREGVQILVHFFPRWDACYAHEIDSLAHKRIVEHESGYTYLLKRQVAMKNLGHYLKR